MGVSLGFFMFNLYRYKVGFFLKYLCLGIWFVLGFFYCKMYIRVVYILLRGFFFLKFKDLWGFCF